MSPSLTSYDGKSFESTDCNTSPPDKLFNSGILLLNPFNLSVPILDFWQCRLLTLTTYFGKFLKKHCSAGQYEQLFYKYFPIHRLVF
jgi:hypothetical protein